MVDTRFGYALANGTVGVYDRTSRFWRIKVGAFGMINILLSKIWRINEIKLLDLGSLCC